MQSIDGIAIIEQLGQGGMGTVFRARHPHLGEVALKVMQGIAADDYLRFEREALAAARIRHPHVVGVHLVGNAEGRPYLVMPLIEGQSLLSSVQRQGPLPEPIAARIGAQLASALGAIHDEGVLHRDVKPANVFLDQSGDARLGDFGLAQLSDRERLTQTGEVLGSPSYMAPEQACGERERMGPATDVYGLGATLYHALSGREPFQGGSVAVILDAVVNSRLVPLRRHRPEIAPELEAIVARCLAKEPEARYPEARAVEQALQAFLQRSDPRMAAARRRRVWSARALAGALLAAGVVAAAQIVTSAEVGRAQPSPPGPSATPSASSTSAPSATPSPSEASDPLAIEPRELVLQPGPLQGRDTHLRVLGYYHNDNFGCEQTMTVGYRAGPQAGSQIGPYWSFLRFGLERLPAGAELLSASLRLTPDRSNHHGMPIQVWLVEEPWLEGTSTQDGYLDGVCSVGDLPAGHPLAGNYAVDSDRPELSAPDCAPEPFLTVTAEEGDPSIVELDVTEAVRAWLAGAPNYGVRLTTDDAAPPDRWVRRGFWSSDAVDPTLRPQLVIRYTGAPPAPDSSAELRARAEERLGVAIAEIERELERYAGEEGAPTRRLLTQASAAIDGAPHDWRGFVMRARVFDRFDRGWPFSCQCALRDVRQALWLAPAAEVPALRELALRLLREILELPGREGGPERVDEQLALMQAVAWDELRALRDEVHALVPNPRRWGSRFR